MNSKFVIYQFVVLCLIVVTMGCDEDDPIDIENHQQTDEYFVFGSFAGFCAGEACIEIFKIQNGQLFEDSKDMYPSSNELPYEGDFELLPREKYELVTDVPDEFPDKLREEINLVLGMPDAYDQGGIYVEIKRNDKIQYWVLDRDKSNLPEYLHDWVELVKAKVELLR